MIAPEQTELYTAMMSCKRYTHDAAVEAIEALREGVADGDDPEELLHEEGFEPDYIFDILDI